MLKRHPDYFLIIICTILIIFGILILASVSTIISQEKFKNPFYFLSRHLLLGLLPGILLAFLISKVRLNLLKKWSPFLLLLNLVILALVFVPGIGISLGGASRWVNFKIFSLQPAEFLKITFFLYLAAWLESKMKKKDEGKSYQNRFRKRPLENGNGLTGLFAFFILLSTIGLFLILQPNISTLGVITLVGVMMYFASGTPLWHSFLIIGILGGGFFLLINKAAYRLSRWQVFLNPNLDPLGQGYQIKQSLIAIGSGGIFGLGLGMSRQKFGFLPESTSDTIFAILTEEMGFIGGVVIIALFLMFLWRGIKIGKESSDLFSRLTSLGISSWICLQAFIHIGSSIKVLPLTGIPLPFISYGGSHLVAELIGVGILLNISKKI